ncbi:helix-turn-helix domain-containing protein [Dorea longicatena]|uniref:helix-turn-helix domain-containing protein n=2 Tax=Lachnospiraceae TaxID=186803 RepID=UPI000415C47A|nr:helix-turn-helix domain-containing protein [Dorea longicatena]
MAYTVRKLLESEQFPKMKLLCGEKGLDLEVKGIRIIEIEDMERYLTGGEILITSFQVYLSCNDREVEQHFEDLVKSDISGFIVKKRKEYDPTGRRLSLLEKHCKKYEIPLVEISEDSYYWGIIRYVMIQVFDKDTARLKYFKITHDSFNTFILKNNGSSNTASDIIKFLSIMIENPVVLYYGNLNCMVSTNSDNSKLILSDEIQPYKPNIITKFQYMKQMKGSCVQYVVKFAILSEVEIYITITEENRELTELDYMAIENAIINLQYGFLSEFAQDEVKKKYQRDIVHNILNGLLSSKEMTEAALQLGMKESDTYRVVDFHTIKKNVQRKYTKEQLQEVGVIVGELMHLLPDALIYRNMDQIVMIQQVDSNQTELEYQKEMEEVEDVIQRSILYRKKDTDFQIGIGKSVEGYQRLKESYHEASRAIKYIDIIRQVTGDKNKSVVHYSNLGFFQIFGEIDDVTELERYIPETLKKLYLYDDEHKGELITTLQMYLRNNQSIKKTADAMFVHYRTISYRLEKIKQISGINFDNANEVLAVSNGLIIYKMLKEIE